MKKTDVCALWGSWPFRRISHNTIADMQAMSDIYLTDELLIEYGYKKQPGTEKTVA